MAKGLAERRRLKRALEAARGNLHKIANGKALPRGLPEAPKPQNTDQLPASLRKMLALKEVAAQKGKKPRVSDKGAGTSKGPGRPLGSRASGQDGDAADGPSTSGRQGAEAAAGQPAAGKGRTSVKGANAFTEQFVVKKLKDKKKDYLKRKEEKKRKKGGSGELVVEKELQLRDNVKFGEVVHAPLNVNLKRKHWADKEKTANERCKEVFLKQMQQAQQRMAGQASDEGLNVRTQGKKGSASKPAGGEAAVGKGKKRKVQADPESEELRQQVIEMYRAAKKGGGSYSVGNATLSTLSSLVGKGAGGKAAAGGSKTHTLA